MKKRGMSNRIKHIVVFASCLMLAVMGVWNVGFPQSVVYADKTEDAKDAEETKQITMSAKTTVGNYARYNEKAEVVTTVTNNGEDFNGYIQIFMWDDGKNLMYQTDLVLAAGETKNVNSEVRMITSANQLMVYVKDLDENVVNKQRLKVKMLDNEDCLVGILTDNKQNLGYWDKNKVVYLKKEDITSAGGMGILDVLIINDFNTGDWDKKQYEALKEWVEQGGNLIIGTGDQVTRTLAIFQDDYLVGKIGNVEKGVADISFEKESETGFPNEDFTLHKVKKGIGQICIINKDLGLDKSEWTKKGYAYLDDISSEYTQSLQERLQTGNTGDVWTDNYNSGYLLRDVSQVPDVGMFTIILMIYIIIISIVIYVVLKKKDKQSWTWGAIPLAAVIFTGVIIGVGSRTRINGAGLYYAKIMEFQEEGNSGVKDRIDLSVISASNADYEIAVPEGIEVYAGNSGYYYEDYDGGDFGYYDLGFKTVDGREFVMLKNNSTFETVNLKAESIETVEGNYKSDMYYADGKISGTFTNNTNLTMKNVVYYGEQRIYQLGTIKPGETVKITEKTPSAIYGYDIREEEFYKIAGLNMDRKKWSLQEARYMEALENNAFEMYTNEDGSNFVCGYIEDMDDEEMKKQWGMDCDGITLVKCPVSVDYTQKDGSVSVPDILKYTKIKEGYYDNEERTMEEGELILDYMLEDDENIKEILFVAALNPSIDKKVSIASYINAYQGDIQLYNWKTKKYDTVFHSDKEGKITDVKQYVGKGNVIRVRLKPQNTNSYSIYIPVISVKKEVNQDG